MKRLGKRTAKIRQLEKKLEKKVAISNARFDAEIEELEQLLAAPLCEPQDQLEIEIINELQKLSQGKLKQGDTLGRLWDDFCLKAAKHATSSPYRIPQHPSGYEKRFRNLHKAFKAMKPEDLELLSIALLYAKKVKISENTFDKIIKVLPVICENHSRMKINLPHRSPSRDGAMSDAVNLWRKHFDTKIHTTKKSYFTQFANLFFRLIDRDKWKEQDISNRIRKELAHPVDISRIGYIARSILCRK